MRKIIFCLAIIGVMCTVGCTERAWYEGAKQSQRNECYKAPPSAREECLKTLDSESYDEYQRTRREELKK